MNIKVATFTVSEKTSNIYPDSQFPPEDTLSLCLLIVYVEWNQNWSRVNYWTIFGDQYQIKLCGIISNNLNQFTYLGFASGVYIARRLRAKIVLFRIQA